MGLAHLFSVVLLAKQSARPPGNKIYSLIPILCGSLAMCTRARSHAPREQIFCDKTHCYSGNLMQADAQCNCPCFPTIRSRGECQFLRIEHACSSQVELSAVVAVATPRRGISRACHAWSGGLTHRVGIVVCVKSRCIEYSMPLFPLLSGACRCNGIEQEALSLLLFSGIRACLVLQQLCLVYFDIYGEAASRAWGIIGSLPRPSSQCRPWACVSTSRVASVTWPCSCSTSSTTPLPPPVTLSIVRTPRAYFSRRACTVVPEKERRWGLLRRIGNQVGREDGLMSQPWTVMMARRAPVCMHG